MANSWPKEDYHCTNDSTIHIGTVISESMEYSRLGYNISEFLRNYGAMGAKWHAKIETYLQKLDEKVRVDFSDDRTKGIIQGIDRIVEKLLIRMDRPFVSKRFTGSLFADFRVGQPYEADVLLEVMDCGGYDLYNYAFDNFTPNIIKAAKVVQDDNWVIHSIESHRVGVCLTTEYNDNHDGQPSAKVLVDLVPIRKSYEHIADSELTDNALNYMKPFQSKLNFTKYSFEENYEDTGYLEHDLLCYLPKNVKMGYRVAKYLIHTFLVSDEYCARSVPKPDYILEILSKEEDFKSVAKYYGCKAAVKSHILQVFLFQLRINSDVGRELKGATLTFCLLDMLYKLINRGSTLLVKNPLLRSEKQEAIAFTEYNKAFVRKSMHHLSCSLLKHIDIGQDTLSAYKLVNVPIEESVTSVESSEIFNKLTGFCFGLKPEVIASQHNCLDGNCDSLREDDFSRSKERYEKIVAATRTLLCQI